VALSSKVRFHQPTSLSKREKPIQIQELLHKKPVLEYVNKILSSKLFAGSESLKILLRFLVKKVLWSEEHHIKEYLLGIEVFHRKENFDPRIDTIVRVQARRLRLKLKQYYEHEGTHDAVRIEIPKGSYIPVIVYHKSADLPCKTGLNPTWCRIAVLPFADLSKQSSDDFFADAVTETLIDDLTMAGNMDVISRTSAFAFKQRKNDVRRIGKYLNIDAVLEGSVQQVSQVVRIKARLVNAHTGFTLWTTTFDVKSGNPLAMQKHISDAIVPDVRSLLSPTP